MARMQPVDAVRYLEGLWTQAGVGISVEIYRGIAGFHRDEFIAALNRVIERMPPQVIMGTAQDTSSLSSNSDGSSSENILPNSSGTIAMDGGVSTTAGSTIDDGAPSENILPNSSGTIATDGGVSTAAGSTSDDGAPSENILPNSSGTIATDGGVSTAAGSTSDDGAASENILPDSDETTDGAVSAAAGVAGDEVASSIGTFSVDSAAESAAFLPSDTSFTIRSGSNPQA
jgi:hypothetical protein